MATSTRTSVVPRGLDGARLDRALRELLDVPRSEIGRLVGSGSVEVNGRVVRLASWQVHDGDRIGLAAEPSRRDEWAFDERWILRTPERDGIAAVDKPSGLRSEPTRPGDTQNLLTLAAPRFGDGLHLVHRLDRDTSGVVLLATPAADRRALDHAFQSRAVDKRYLAVVSDDASVLDEAGELRHRLARDPARRDRMVVVPRGGDGALTRYIVLERRPSSTLLELAPITGRTHQLRVQLAAVGAPILGDRLYGGTASAPRLMLHAASITLTVPDGEMVVRAPTPAGF